MIKRRIITYEGDAEWINTTLQHSLKDGITPIGTVNKITVQTVEDTASMTAEEAVTKLRSIFQGSVLAEKSCWYFSSKGEEKTMYRLSFNFGSVDCSQVEGTSFEDCFAQIGEVNKETNRTIAKYSILLRKFD